MLWWEKYALQSMFKSAEQKQWGGGLHLLKSQSIFSEAFQRDLPPGPFDFQTPISGFPT